MAIYTLSLKECGVQGPHLYAGAQERRCLEKFHAHSLALAWQSLSITASLLNAQQQLWCGANIYLSVADFRSGAGQLQVPDPRVTPNPQHKSFLSVFCEGFFFFLSFCFVFS